jgi:RNA polymerase sigma-54 factor
MKQTLQLKLTQHLTLTPQLQQSIRLLQLSTLELNAEVDRMLQENPLLEREEGDEEVPPQEFPLSSMSPGPVTTERSTREEEGDGDADGMTGVDSAPTRDDLPDVTDFSDYGGGGDGDWGGGGSSNEDDDFAPQQVASSSLRDHLMEQLRLLNLPLRDRQVVEALIDALDDDGYLSSSLEEIAEMFSEDDALEPEELTIGLKYVQSFEPAGVGARSPAECLALQLKTLPDSTPFRPKR